MRKWTVLMIGENNGLLGAHGDTFQGSPEHYDRIDVVPLGHLQLLVDHIELLKEENAQLRKLLRERDEKVTLSHGGAANTGGVRDGGESRL